MHEVYAASDLHGNYDLFKAMMDWCKKQDDEYTLLYLGDACDRGPDGYRIMRELLDNPQVVYLKGNHEDMFVHAARFIINDYKSNGPVTEEQARVYLDSICVRDFYGSQVTDCIYNGGRQTLVDWMVDGMSNGFVSRLSHLPLTFSYGIIDFCHAGGDYDTFARVAEDEYYEAEFLDLDDVNTLIWDRYSFRMPWEKGRVCVHGHTPTFHLPMQPDRSHENAHPSLYISREEDDRRSGAKIDLDVGTITNGKFYVFNCLTWEAYGFQDFDFKNNEVKNHHIEQNEVIQL